VVSVLMHDCPALNSSELPQLRGLILRLLAPVVRACPSVLCDAHQLGLHVPSVWQNGTERSILFRRAAEPVRAFLSDHP
jgi:hypothetical protein